MRKYDFDVVAFVLRLLKERGIAVSKMEKDLGFGNGYIRNLKRGQIPVNRLMMIADYLGESYEFLILCGHDELLNDVHEYALRGIDYELLALMHELDETGQERLLEHAQMLVQSGRFSSHILRGTDSPFMQYDEVSSSSRKDESDE